MTTDYAAPDPAIAEMIYRHQVESDEQYQRLEHAPTVQLKAVVRDPKEPQAARLNALLFLLTHRDPEMPEILFELLHDPDQEIWRSVIRSYRPADARITAKLRSLLDDPHERYWSEAAWALARSKDTTLLPRLSDWLQTGDRSHRNVAIECLKALDVPEARRLLRDFWNQAADDQEDQLVAGAALLSVGETSGLGLLESTAHGARGSWSVFAATSIYHFHSRHGLELMLRILDEGDLEAKQSMVNQIWNYAHLPHAFTADGIHEARVWVEAQLETSAI